MTRETGRGGAGEKRGPREPLPGIVIAAGGRRAAEADAPRISAFIWGGKVRPTPTLPYGRWRGAA